MIDIIENSGTSPGEVFLVTFFVPATSLLIKLILNFCYSYKMLMCLEVVALNVILLLSLTVFSNYLVFLIVIYIMTLTIAFWFALHKFTLGEIILKLKDVSQESIKEKDFDKVYIGDYRGHLLLATSICILAVDFKIFPSKFAKTETFGWSVMDAGVGSFIVLHGLCSAHGKQLNENSLKTCSKSSFPLLVLGFLRLALTRIVGYHKVVSEYGIHWNFFFTLAFTKVICCFALKKFEAGLLAVSTLIIHQLFLTKLGLSNLILSSSRQNLFEANKEGICSLMGFASLYFFGVQLGRLLWGKKKTIKEYYFLVVKLCCIGVCGWCLMYLAHHKCQYLSRRMANLSYCIWIISLTSLQISVHLCYCLIITIIKTLFKIKSCENLLWNVLNYNGLFYFLLANLLTGFVNMTSNTAEMSNLGSLCILCLYLTTLFLSSFVLYRFNIKL